MKFLLNRKIFLENNNWSDNLSNLIEPFNDAIEDMTEKLKDDFNDKDDPIEVHKLYVKKIMKAFKKLVEEVRLVKDEEDLRELWSDMSLNIVFWKDKYDKLSKEIEGCNAVFKLGYEIFKSMTTYNTKKISQEYYSALKGNIDDMRENVVKYIDSIKSDIGERMIEINSEDIFNMSNLDEKELEDIVTNAGDEIRYYMSDGEENIAIISYNQEGTDNEELRVTSKKDGEQFKIDRKDLIEIIPKTKTINQEVSDKLKKIKDDPNKLGKLNDYLDELKVDEKYEYKHYDKTFIYDFENKDGITFRVKFRKHSNYYEREYFILSKDKNNMQMLDIDEHDSYNILDTVSYITKDFIEKFNPDKIVIVHIFSKKEKSKNAKGNSQRAKVNQRFLKRYIPNNYEIELKDNVTYITKK